jgi:uncharacterized DUF497 family protein
MQEPSFDWDEEKERTNLEKPGVGFSDAQHASFDLDRVIAEDLTHSTRDEKR